MVRGLKLKFALILHFFIKFRIEIIKVFGIQFILCFFQRFTESLEMDDFPGTQEFQRFPDFRIGNHAQQVVINGPGLLFCRQVFCKVRNGIALGLKLKCCKGDACGGLGPKGRGVIDIICVKAGFLCLLYSQVLRQLVTMAQMISICASSSVPISVRRPPTSFTGME